MQTIKTTWAELAEHTPRVQADFVRLTELDAYGFDGEIVTLMIKHDVFPQTFVISGTLEASEDNDVYVLRDQVQEVVRDMLRNSMRIYEDVAELDKRKDALLEHADAIKLDSDMLAKIESGEWTIDDAKQHTKTKISEILADKETPCSL